MSNECYNLKKKLNYSPNKDMEKDFAPKIGSLSNQNRIKTQENKYTKNHNEEDVVDPKRRAFLLGMAALTGTAIAAKVEPKFQLLKLFQKFIQPKTTEKSTENESTEDVENPLTIEDGRSISEIINYDDPKDFSFNKETVESLKQHWKKSYIENPNLKNSLDGALTRINPWKKQLKEIFAHEGVPKHLAYLAIPESHFMLDAHSRKNAVGPYQFTVETAHKYGLKVQGKHDERIDPTKSAHACAKLLKDLHKVSKDWDISLSAYNGGFAWKYLNDAYKNGNEISYEDFLKHLSDLANEKRNEIKNNKSLLHTVKSKENLGGIANKYHIPLIELLKYNHLHEKSVIKEGKSILIPLTQENKRKIFEQKIAGIAENLSYSPRCNAIFELIQEHQKA